MNATKTTNLRKQRNLQPVNGKCRWIGGNPTLAQLDHGLAMLLIVADGKEPQAYHVERLRDDDGRTVGYRLVKAGLGAASYDIGAASWTCDCPDAVYNDARPGGCKHANAVRAALTCAGLL